MIYPNKHHLLDHSQQTFFTDVMKSWSIAETVGDVDNTIKEFPSRNSYHTVDEFEHDPIAERVCRQSNKYAMDFWQMMHLASFDRTNCEPTTSILAAWSCRCSSARNWCSSSQALSLTLLPLSPSQFRNSLLQIVMLHALQERETMCRKTNQLDILVQPWVSLNPKPYSLVHIDSRSGIPMQRPLPLKLVTVGKDRGTAMENVAVEYVKKIQRYCAFEEVQLRPNPKNSRYSMYTCFL